MGNITQKTKVAIVEDQRELREGFSTMINFTTGFECTGVYRSMEEALSLEI